MYCIVTFLFSFCYFLVKNRRTHIFFSRWFDGWISCPGMVVFRIKGENDLTERLLKRLNHRGHLHCVPASLKGKYVIRYRNRFIFTSLQACVSLTYPKSIIFFDSFTITSTHTSNDDLLKDWSEIRKVSTELLEELNIHISDRARVHLKGFTLFAFASLNCFCACIFIIGGKH